LIGSFETIAKLLDEAAEIPGAKGIMLIFDDFLEGMDKFGKRIQPLMKSRAHINGVVPS
jgi:pyrimidine oxygenase